MLLPIVLLAYHTVCVYVNACNTWTRVVQLVPNALMLGLADWFRGCSQLPAQQLNTVQCARTRALVGQRNHFFALGELIPWESS